jgi:hypothetical protein
VLAYHRQHSDFPHQSTANQWFTESQFESYRRLGQHATEELLRDLKPASKKASNLFQAINEKKKNPAVAAI